MKNLVYLILGLGLLVALSFTPGCSYYASLTANKLGVQQEIRVNGTSPAPALDTPNADQPKTIMVTTIPSS